MSFETDLQDHYSTGRLLPRIDVALKAAGADPDHLTIDDLKPVDEFHTGGIEATAALLDQLEIGPATAVIDLGCGLGGTARHIVHRYGARVSGIDLTPEYLDTGRALNDRLGLSDWIALEQGSVLDLPFDPMSADLVTMFHVGMNVEDKATLFAEAARVLKPGGHFALFDVMRGEDRDGALLFPLPWASRAELSHVDPPETYRAAAEAAGLVEHAERDRTDFARAYFERVFALVAEHGMPPLGIHLLMGDTAAEKLSNYVETLRAGRIRPTEMIFRRPA
ncbi:methyltransferase domain-containing protein [Rhodobacterales bacterium HKCCE2091]|nr:methyltransferase domain-containing protein [Rhodobacterales bacterium HKCCE2091]